jgi:uncharacterized protein YdeI (YjbR/CyaY-like superfamily)
MAEKSEDPILEFANAAAFGKWLAKHHASERALLIKMHKKASGLPSVTWDEAIDEALCWGWIDGVRRSFDENSFLQRFTPRRPKSIWSKRNIEKVGRLVEDGRMQKPGLAKVEAAKSDGRWQAAYEGVAKAEIPDDLLAALEAEPGVMEFYGTLSSQNRYAIYHRTVTAKKPETRAKRIAQFVDMLKRGETIYPQKGTR